jgi:hypothetical protein
VLTVGRQGSSLGGREGGREGGNSEPFSLFWLNLVSWDFKFYKVAKSMFLAGRPGGGAFLVAKFLHVPYIAKFGVSSATHLPEERDAHTTLAARYRLLAGSPPHGQKKRKEGTRSLFLAKFSKLD